MNPLNKILLGCGAAIALIIAIIIVWLSLANAHLKTQLAISESKNNVCAMANDDFRAAVERQNQALQQLSYDKEAQAARAAAAEQQAQNSIRIYQQDVARLKRRTSSGDDCKSASDLLDYYILGEK